MATRARALVAGSTRADRFAVALLAAAAGIAVGGVVSSLATAAGCAAVVFALVVGAGKQTAA